MKIIHGVTRLSATDLSHQLLCPTSPPSTTKPPAATSPHLTTLDHQAARGDLAPPDFRNPHAATLQALGLAHDRAYLQQLAAQHLTVIDLTHVASETEALRRTTEAMQNGADVIVQAALAYHHWAAPTLPRPVWLLVAVAALAISP